MQEWLIAEFEDAKKEFDKMPDWKVELAAIRGIGVRRTEQTATQRRNSDQPSQHR